MDELLILQKKIKATIKFTKKNNVDALNLWLCEKHRKEVDEQTEQSNRENKNHHKKKRVGFVYLMIDNITNKVKIGFSRNPKYREATLQSQKPDISLLYTVESSIDFERHLHEKYNQQRVRGELFDINPNEVIGYIKSVAV